MISFVVLTSISLFATKNIQGLFSSSLPYTPLTYRIASTIKTTPMTRNP